MGKFADVNSFSLGKIFDQYRLYDKTRNIRENQPILLKLIPSAILRLGFKPNSKTSFLNDWFMNWFRNRCMILNILETEKPTCIFFYLFCTSVALFLFENLIFRFIRNRISEFNTSSTLFGSIMLILTRFVRGEFIICGSPCESTWISLSSKNCYCQRLRPLDPVLWSSMSLWWSHTVALRLNSLSNDEHLDKNLSVI